MSVEIGFVPDGTDQKFVLYVAGPDDVTVLTDRTVGRERVIVVADRCDEQGAEVHAIDDPAVMALEDDQPIPEAYFTKHSLLAVIAAGLSYECPITVSSELEEFEVIAGVVDLTGRLVLQHLIDEPKVAANLSN